ncbi:MAG: hypothetical protein V5A41_01375 [Haloarculaceae archaeon]
MQQESFISRRAVLATGAALTVPLAGCSGSDTAAPTEDQSDEMETDDPTSDAAGTECQTPGDDLTAVFPDTEEYTLSSTNTFTDDSPYGTQSAIGVYNDVDGSRYEFLIIEFEDATTAQEKTAEVISENEYAETGYLTVGKYFFGLAGPNRDVITALLGAAAPLTECVDDNLQFR